MANSQSSAPISSQQHYAIPTARDVMVGSVITLTPDMSVFEAIQKLVASRISGAPVVDENGKILGMLEELDCLGVLASDQFHSEDYESRVRDYMTERYETVEPDCDIYRLALYFRDKPVRRFPVMEGNRLVGQVSRRDVLRGIDEMRRKLVPRKHYPDYREPA